MSTRCSYILKVRTGDRCKKDGRWITANTLDHVFLTRCDEHKFPTDEMTTEESNRLAQYSGDIY